MCVDTEKFDEMYQSVKDIHRLLLVEKVNYQGLCGMEEALKKVGSMFGSNLTIDQALTELDIIKRM